MPSAFSHFSDRALFVLAVLVLAPWASLAQADEKPAELDAGALFGQLDGNSDGALDMDEVPAEKQRLLKRLLRTSDANQDGKLSREEFAAGLKGAGPDRKEAPPAEARGGLDADVVFRRMDANADGKITGDEIPQERREGFGRLVARLDGNGDGALSRDEFGKAGPMLERLSKGRPPQDAPGAGPAAAPDALALFRALDQDGDGKISSGEINKAPESLAKLDKNGDGAITLEELDRARPRLPLAAAEDRDPAQIWRQLLSGDKNSDGKLSEEEMPPRLRRAFSRIDQDGDGFVDESELKRGMKRLRGAAGKAD